MNLETVKYIKQLPLGEQLENAEIANVDSLLRRLTLFFSDGKIIEVTGDYGVKIAVSAPPKNIKRHKVTATVLGVDMTKHFEYDTDASTYYQKLNSIDGRDSDVIRSIVEVSEDETEKFSDSIPF